VAVDDVSIDALSGQGNDHPEPMRELHRRRVARASAIVMLGFLGGKLSGYLRQIVIAARFGTGADYEAYVAAAKLPELVFTLVAGGALVTAFLPVLSGYITRGDDAETWRLSSAVTNLIFLCTAAVSTCVALGAPVLVSRVVAPGFTPDQQALTASMMRWLLIGTLIFSISGIQMAILNAFHHFLLPALAPIAYNFGIILGALLLGPSMGINALVVGSVGGACLHLLVKLPGLLRYGMRYYPILGLTHPGVRTVGRLVGPRVLTLAVVQLNFIIAYNLASRLSVGRLAAFEYGWDLMQMPQTVLGTAIATAAFPTLAELAAGQRISELRSAVADSLSSVLVLTIPAAVGVVALGEPFIRLLFERGAFDVQSTAGVYLALRFFALGIVTHSALEIVARLFYAQRDAWTPFGAAAVALLLNLALSLALVGSLHQGGLALANSLAVGVEVAVLLSIGAKRLGGLHAAHLMSSTWRACAAAGGMWVVITVYCWALPTPETLVAQVAWLAGAVSLALAAYWLVARRLGLPEVSRLPGLVLRRG
jgi:putative peptidoglycan lipid II flippase